MNHINSSIGSVAESLSNQASMASVRISLKTEQARSTMLQHFLNPFDCICLASQVLSIPPNIGAPIGFDLERLANGLRTAKFPYVHIADTSYRKCERQGRARETALVTPRHLSNIVYQFDTGTDEGLNEQVKRETLISKSKQFHTNILLLCTKSSVS